MSIIATMDTHAEDYMETNEGKNLPVPHCVKDTKGWKIVPQILDALAYANPMYLPKDRFGSPELPGLIRTVAMDGAKGGLGAGENLSVTIIGWCTDICVISNALIVKSAFPEAEVFVDADCCAGVTPEAHEAALTVLRSCQIKVV